MLFVTLPFLLAAWNHVLVVFFICQRNFVKNIEKQFTISIAIFPFFFNHNILLVLVYLNSKNLKNIHTNQRKHSSLEHYDFFETF